MNETPLLVVGSVGLDTIHLPSGSFRRVPGGSATYAALAAAPFGGASLVGVVGEDFPAGLIDALSSRRVNLDGLQVVPGKTFFWEGRYAEDLKSRVSLDTQLNVFADFSPTIPGLARDARVVLLGNIHPDLQLNVLAQLQSPRVVITDTMDFWIEGQPQKLAEVLRRTHILMVNEDEARQLTGQSTLLRMADAVRQMGPQTLVIKQGEYGAFVVHDETVFMAPAYPLRDVLDPTGAGDTFAGAFGAFLAGGPAAKPNDALVRRATIYGTAAASFVVEAVSIERLLDLSRPALQERYAFLKKLTAIPQQD